MSDLNKKYLKILPITNKHFWRASIRGFILDHGENNWQELNYFDFSDDIYTVHRLWNSRDSFNKQEEGIEIIYSGDPFNMKDLYEERANEMFD